MCLDGCDENKFWKPNHDTMGITEIMRRPSEYTGNIMGISWEYAEIISMIWGLYGNTGNMSAIFGDIWGIAEATSNTWDSRLKLQIRRRFAAIMYNH